ncbi:hypothetical protein J6590_031907 [Homalodisca vitripennis]|nr:hypothetical protein J6590_031907 [Homalodisca vitripennis]
MVARPMLPTESEAYQYGFFSLVTNAATYGLVHMSATRRATKRQHITMAAYTWRRAAEPAASCVARLVHQKIKLDAPTTAFVVVCEFCTDGTKYRDMLHLPLPYRQCTSCRPPVLPLIRPPNVYGAIFLSRGVSRDTSRSCEQALKVKRINTGSSVARPMLPTESEAYQYGFFSLVTNAANRK